MAVIGNRIIFNLNNIKYRYFAFKITFFFVDSDFVIMALDCDLILMIVFLTINIIFCVSTEQQQ